MSADQHGVRRYLRDTRGQSETIGVVLLLAITVTGATAVVALGGSAIQESKQTVATESAEQAMTKLDSQASLVAHGASDAQTVSVPRTRSASVRVEPTAGWLNVSIVNASDGTLKRLVMNVTLGKVVYELDGTEIAYQGGGVWRSEESGATMVSPPELHYTGTTLTLPLVIVRGDAVIEDRARITQTAPPTARYPNSTAGLRNPLRSGMVNVTVHSEYYEAWSRFMETRTVGAVSVNDSRETARLTLVVPTSSQQSNVTGGVISGTGGSTLNLKEFGTLDSYNSSVGDYAASSGTDTSVVLAGSLELKEKSDLYGDATVGEDIIMKEDAHAHGNISYGNSKSIKSSATIDGWIAQNATVNAPDSVADEIDEKRVEIQNDNDNAAVSGTIDDIENSNCGSGCELPAGEYYLDRVKLGPSSSGQLTLNTTAGDIDIVVDGTFETFENTNITVVGDGRVNVYVEEDVTMKLDSAVTNAGQDAPQFWVYMNPGSSTTFDQKASFVGVIYGPASDTQGGTVITPKEDADVYGALVGNVNDIKEGAAVHYDEALNSVEAVDQTGAGSRVPRLTYLHVSTTNVTIAGA